VSGVPRTAYVRLCVKLYLLRENFAI
jgi:hypothetical protein